MAPSIGSGTGSPPVGIPETQTKPKPKIQMATHLPASPRTRGGAVDPREGSLIRKPVFSRYPVGAAFRWMSARLSPVYPWMAAGGLSAIAFLIFQSGGSQQPDAGRRTAAILRRTRVTPEARLHERLNGQAGAADPTATLARAFALEKGNGRECLVRDLLSAWAARDAEAALSWISSLEDPSARRSARSTVCLAVAEKDPRQAVVLALAHGADEDDDRGLLEGLTMQWCEKESEAALDWAITQPPGEWRNRLVAGASFVVSKLDPVRAAHLVSELEPGTLQDEAAMAVLHQWALKDSSAALEWAEAFSEPAFRERALAEISNLRSGMAAREAD